MNILVTSNYFPGEHPGGVESVARVLVAGYRKRGHSVRWTGARVTARPPGLTADDRPLRAWNVTERRLGFPYPLPGPISLARLEQDVRWADAIHVNDSLYAVSQAVCYHAARLRRPVLLTQHVPPIPYRNPAIRALQRAAYLTLGHPALRRADQVAFVSEAVASSFRSLRLRRPPVVVENAIDTDLFRPVGDAERARARHRAGASPGQPLLLFVGRFVAKKGLERVRAAAEATPDATWVLAGPAGDVDPTAWRLGNVRVAGPLPQERLADLYRAADLLVLPSVGEGFPVSVQEALASGTPAVVSPAIGSSLPGLDDVVFPIASDVADTVRKALACAPGRREAAAALARGRWSADAVIDRYEDLLREILE